MSIAPSAIERLQDIAGRTGALGRQRHPHHRGRARRKQSGTPPQRVPLWQFRSPSPTSGRQLTWGLCLPRTRTVPKRRSRAPDAEARRPKAAPRRIQIERSEASPAGALAAASDRPASRCRGYPRLAGVAGCVIATWLMTRCARRCTSQSAANMITITSTKPTIAAHITSMLPD